jgi:hypothetical protein
MKVKITKLAGFITIIAITFSLSAPAAEAQISTLQQNLDKSTISSEQSVKKTSAETSPAASTNSGGQKASATKNSKPAATSATALIPDDEFTNPDFMTAEELTAILKSMDSPMAQEYDGVNPAEVIMEVAKENNVNPLVILATMQKENGLVQTKKKISKFKLDWAMGVGVYDNGKMNQAYKGFKNQITGAAATFRKNFDKGADLLGAKKSTKLPINYGKATFAPTNAATYSLYSYTPHTHGAKLFTSIYKSYKSKLEKVRSASGNSAAQPESAPQRIIN